MKTMKEVSFTPGPWCWPEDGPLVSADGRQLMGLLGRHQGRSIQEIKANRILIAAAPDLLAACEAAYRALESFRMYCSDDEWRQYDDFCAAHKQLQEARAKATQSPTQS